MSAFPDHPFWSFSLAGYGRPGVAPALLSLQDTYGANVNLLLLGCWAAASGRGRIRADAFAMAAAAVEGWQKTILHKLRDVRRALKSTPFGVPTEQIEDLRGRILQCEIDAEHSEQLLLASYAPGEMAERKGLQTRAEDGAWNLCIYLSTIGSIAASVDQRMALAPALSAILGGCFPELPEPEARALAERSLQASSR